MHLTLLIIHSIAEILPAVSTMRDSSNFNQTKRLKLALEDKLKKTKKTICKMLWTYCNSLETSYLTHFMLRSHTHNKTYTETITQAENWVEKEELQAHNALNNTYYFIM